MTYATVDVNGVIQTIIECPVGNQPQGALDASTLTQWQLRNNSFVTWNGSAWVVSANIPTQVDPETPTARAVRLKTYLQNNGFTSQQATTLTLVLKEISSLLA